IECQWGLWSGLARSATAATPSLKDSVTTMAARLGHQPKTCIENEPRPGCPLQSDLPLTTSQELVEGGPEVTFPLLIPLADMGTDGAVPGKEQPDLQIRYDTALVDLSQVDRWC
ncbi:hypothetical protein AX16_000796, partial [Volvariella volvacea WC 439]